MGDSNAMRRAEPPAPIRQRIRRARARGSATGGGYEVTGGTTRAQSALYDAVVRTRRGTKMGSGLGNTITRRAVALLIVGLVAWTGALAEMSPSVARGHGLLWEVTGGGDGPSYVFGTIHISDPRVTRLPEPVRSAFAGARTFTMEVLVDYAAYERVMRSMFYTDGRTLEQVIGDKLFGRVAKRLAELGMSRAAVMNMKPWAVMATLGVPLMDRGTALDLELYADAVEQGKPVYGLESVNEQLNVFEAMPRQAQVEMVRSSIQPQEATDSQFEAFLKAYLDRDLTGLMRLADRYTAADYPAFRDAFMEQAIRQRNRRMVERMQPRLQDGGAFIAVGALHLPGAHGVLHLLERRGFSVTPVY